MLIYAYHWSTETRGKKNLHQLLPNVTLLRPGILAPVWMLLQYFLKSLWYFCSIHFWMESDYLKSFVLDECCLPVCSSQLSVNHQPFPPLWFSPFYLPFSLLGHMMHYLTEIMPCHVLQFIALLPVFPAVISFQNKENSKAIIWISPAPWQDHRILL